MGNKKNSRGSQACRGKYAKKRVPGIKKKANNRLHNTGCRIVNLKKLQEHLHTITQHAATCQLCTNKALSGDEAVVLVGEHNREGFCSILTSRCAGCQEEFSFSTSAKVQPRSGGQYWECNLAAVWGQMATGGGHAPLTVSMAVMGIPALTKKSFMAIERRIGEWWWDLLQDSMKEAGAKEKALAISKNQYHQGVPAITVVVDGGWCKRTHKHSYNAKSGVGIIISKETGKILYLGVRNKYCAVCNKATNGAIPVHTCFRNWKESSSAMESDIILKGFQQSEQQHGLRYIRFIGDGDSSVHPTLVSGVPWGYAIRKMECANHAVKCYRTALENLVHDKPHYKGRGKLTATMRKKLTKAARSAIMLRSKETDQKQAIQNLQQDLLNGPLHCFGCHSNCSSDFCKTKRQHCNSSSSNMPPNNTDTVTTMTTTEDMDTTEDTTTNRDSTTDSKFTDSDTTTDKYASTITNHDAMNDTTTDDETIINTSDTMNTLQQVISLNTKL